MVSNMCSHFIISYLIIYMFQGDQLSEVFMEFPNVIVNFTLFSLMPYNTSKSFPGTKGDQYNLTLALDTMAVLRDAVPHVLYETEDHAVRKGLTTAISRVSST